MKPGNTIIKALSLFSIAATLCALAIAKPAAAQRVYGYAYVPVRPYHRVYRPVVQVQVGMPIVAAPVVVYGRPAYGPIVLGGRGYRYGYYGRHRR